MTTLQTSLTQGKPSAQGSWRKHHWRTAVTRWKPHVHCFLPADRRSGGCSFQLHEDTGKQNKDWGEWELIWQKNEESKLWNIYLCDGAIWEVGVRGGGSCQNVQHQRVIWISHHAEKCKATHHLLNNFAKFSKRSRGQGIKKPLTQHLWTGLVYQWACQL